MTGRTSGRMQAMREAGFTVVEITIVTVVLVAILGAILSTAGAVQDSVSTNERSAGVEERLRILSDRIRRALRPASLSSFKTRALQIDVDTAKAERAALFYEAKLTGSLTTYYEAVNYPIPKLGDWIFPVSGIVNRSNLQYRAAPGVLSMNIQNLTPERSLEFVMDPKELANGKDDDGDGLVDEGRLFFYRDGKRIWMAEDLEKVAFTVQGRAIVFQLTCARRDSSGGVVRMAQVHTVQIRNN